VSRRRHCAFDFLALLVLNSQRFHALGTLLGVGIIIIPPQSPVLDADIR